MPGGDDRDCDCRHAVEKGDPPEILTGPLTATRDGKGPFPLRGTVLSRDVGKALGGLGRTEGTGKGLQKRKAAN